MKKFILGVICLVLSSVICLGGCASSPAREIKESEESMRLLAWGTPPNGNFGNPPWGAQPSDNTVENWKIMKDVGFDCASPLFDLVKEDVLTTLKNAEEAGIKVLARDRTSPGLPSIIDASAGSSYQEVMNKILAVEDQLIAKYDEFKTYKSFQGIVAKDEPSMEYYEAIAAAQDWWRSKYAGYEFFVNLFPSYATPVQLFGNNAPEDLTFIDYVDELVNTTNPDYLSYDHYALRRSGLTGTIRPAWLYDLEVFAEASKKYNIPFYIFILCTQHLDYINPQTYREIAWQVYSSMAYGAKGIETFQYWSYLIPDNNVDKLGTSLVGPRGEITPLYYAVQEVFQELRSFESLYMAFDWQGTMPVGQSGSGTFGLLRNPLKKLTGVKEVKASEDALIGEFRDEDGNTAYMVTNYSSPFTSKSNTVTMTFENTDRVLVCKKGKKIVEQVKDNRLTLEMGCGEGYFVIPIA